MAVRAIDGNDFLRQLTLDTSKGHYGEFMDGSEVAFTFREIAAFVEQMPTLTQPNEPMTLDELREMDGEPVYVVPKDKPAHCGGWCGVTVWKCDRYSYVSLLRDADSGWGFEKYGKTWIAYRRPPEGEDA